MFLNFKTKFKMKKKNTINKKKTVRIFLGLHKSSHFEQKINNKIPKHMFIVQSDASFNLQIKY